MKKKSLPFQLLAAIWCILLLTIHLATAKIVVTTTADTGAGSLREAIDQANTHAGADTIEFNIPATDPGFDGAIWRIQVASCEFSLKTDSTTIDGFSQQQNQGDTNPAGPEIWLDGQVLSTPAYGLWITSAGNSISGILFTRFQNGGILLDGEPAHHNHIFGNFLGTNATGNEILGNLGGVTIRSGANFNRVGGTTHLERNLISGNDYGIIIEGSRHNFILGNFLGTDGTGEFSLPNQHSGIIISSEAKQNVIGGLEPGAENLISGNGWYGVSIEYENADSNFVQGNRIGTSASGAALPNDWDGLRVLGDAKFNKIGPANIIKYNHYGIRISGELARYNTITQNSIYENQDGGIILETGGNAEISAPLITGKNPVLGTGLPNSKIELFSDAGVQGEIYEATVVADASGNFIWHGTPRGPNLTATVTDASGNTSEFSIPKSIIQVIWVTSTNDFGEGSLREVLERVNSLSGPDTIRFNIPQTDPGFDGSVWWIRPESELPTISGGETCIDGASQRANQGNTNPDGPEIQIDGTRVESYSSGFRITSAQNTISALTISGFRNAGIYVEGTQAIHNSIWGNFIGTTGAAAAGNRSGIEFNNGATGNIVGGVEVWKRNLISGNNENGIIISQSDSNVIRGNFIGTEFTGTTALPNQNDGVTIFGESQFNLVGPGNLISGNSRHGVRILLDGARRNEIFGNLIGTASDGQVALGNGLDGVRVEQNASRNVIGPENLISGNLENGIVLTSPQTDSNTVIGNRIGLNITGQDTLPNRQFGICIQNGSSYNIVGTPESDGRNVIAGNGYSGICLSGPEVAINRIQNNFVGTNAGGTVALGNIFSGIQISGRQNIIENNLISGNRIGVWIFRSQENRVRHNKIGVQADGNQPLANLSSGTQIDSYAVGDSIGPANIIGYNQSYGIVMGDSTVNEITITQNSIAANSFGGIKLWRGANSRLEAPVISGISPLTGTAPANSTVEIFSDSAGQGNIFEGTTTVNAAGVWTWEGSASGPNVTATTTFGNCSSEFSAPVNLTSVTTGEKRPIPQNFSLGQNYPNPFNPCTTIVYDLPQTEMVTIHIFNTRGQLIKKLNAGRQLAGTYQIFWDGTGSDEMPVSSGVYFYRIVAGKFSKVRKMLLMR